MAETTHLVIGSHKRTIKVLQAIARGLWVVGYDWVLGSIARASWLDEEKFEAVAWFPGCRSSRLEHERGLPPLLSGTKVFVNGRNISPPFEELSLLLISCGAELMPSFHSCTLCLSSSTAIRPKKNPQKIPILRVDWLIDSLQDYAKKDYSPYLF